MGNEVFRIHDEWKVNFQGVVLKASWQERGPATACLELLEKGYAVLTPYKGVRYVQKRGLQMSVADLLKEIHCREREFMPELEKLRQEYPSLIDDERFVWMYLKEKDGDTQ